MSSWIATARSTWIGTRVTVLLSRVQALELLDRAYTLAAQTFVSLLPLILGMSTIVVSAGHESVVAEELVRRLGLVGAGAVAMRELIVLSDTRVYWVGVVLLIFSAFSLSRRIGRTYNAVWGAPPLNRRQQWRGLLWILLQMAMIWMVTQLRVVLHDSGRGLAVLMALAIMAVWFVGEFVIQRLFTRGTIARRRLLLAAGLVTLGRVGVTIWGGTFLAASASRQAVSYGPIGLVFGIFTWLFATWVVILGATLIAQVLTAPDATSAPDAAQERDAST